jgi:2-octaprenyl-6-methoxyphenol hydroxylase
MPVAETHDIVIVGGGPVGAALAIALSDSGLDVLVLEARPGGESKDDGRTLAMSYGSRLILERLQAWARIDTPTPIRTIHVSQKGGFGRALLHADDVELPALGYVVSYAELHRALGEALAKSTSRMTTGATVEELQCNERLTVHYRCGGDARCATASLLVLADGGASLGSRAGATLRVRDYHQQAIVGLVTTSQPHAGVAYERFTPDGPVALLPYRDHFALVWTVATSDAAIVTQLAGEEFLARLQAHFGDRAGRFLSISSRACFPLSLRFAADPVLPRIVLLGNAAQALHPIAGQGFNLGLRDAWELADVVMHDRDPDPGCRAALTRYRAARKPDRFGGIAVTDSLVRIFSNNLLPLRIARGGGLALLDVSPALKRLLMQQMIFGASR